MKISTKGRYGLRLMVALAVRYGAGPVRVDVLSRDEDISANYIHVLMGVLKAAGLVRSIRGANGGYELARSPSKITSYEVVSVLEGNTVPVECVAEPGTCPRAEGCPTRNVWCRIAASVDEILKSMTLQDLADEQNRQEEAIHYSI